VSSKPPPPLLLASYKLTLPFSLSCFTLLVGPLKIAFTAPILLLSYYSTILDYFIYGSSSKDPPPTNISLPDLDPYEMAIFTTWLTTGCVPWVRLTGNPELENL